MMKWGRFNPDGWIVKFAWLPVQVLDGLWVWLEKYEYKDIGWPRYKTRLYKEDRQ